MKVEVSRFSETGAVRAENEDSVLEYHDNGRRFHLFLVADGMGGHANGGQASGMIAGELGTWVSRPGTVQGWPDTPAALYAIRDKMQEINDRILERWGREQICGSTCALLFFCGESYGIFSVGDSRIYLSRGFSFTALTRDDVWENQASVRQAMTDEEIRRHPNYGKLLHAVGVQSPLVYSMQTGALKQGDLFVMCSDGVYKMCAERFLPRAARCNRFFGLDRLGGAIRREVYRNGAKDNLSLILVRCGA